MYRIAICMAAAVLCWRTGKWRSWKDYYPTILYAIIGDLAYNFIFHDFSLWEYRGFINHTLSDLLIDVIVFPSVIILFLAYYPRDRVVRTLYFFLWSVGLTLVEFISLKLNYLIYDYGWNIWWSLAIYVGAFLLVRLHYAHPLVVWPISAALAGIVAIIFKLPFEVIK